MGPRRPERTVTVLRRRCVAGAAVAVLAAATPLGAGPIGLLETGAGAAWPGGYAVLDIRDEDRCLERAPPDARCLPASVLLGADGETPLSFHALRWVLGTHGLSGEETLVIYPGSVVPQDDALAVAALLYLAGQAEVLVHLGPATESDDGGAFRALWREVIYTRPMRSGEMAVVAAPEGSLRDRLKDFATGGGSVAFAAGG